MKLRIIQSRRDDLKQRIATMRSRHKRRKGLQQILTGLTTQQLKLEIRMDRKARRAA